MHLAVPVCAFVPVCILSSIKCTCALIQWTNHQLLVWLIESQFKPKSFSQERSKINTTQDTPKYPFHTLWLNKLYLCFCCRCVFLRVRWGEDELDGALAIFSFLGCLDVLPLRNIRRHKSVPLRCLLNVLTSNPFKCLHLRFKWADGDAGGACYLSLDWICLGELLVLPSWRHPFIPAICYFHSLIDDLITASVVCLHNTWVFLVYSITQSRTVANVVGNHAVPSLPRKRSHWHKWAANMDGGG